MLEHIMSMIIPVILILLVLAVLAANIRVVPSPAPLSSSAWALSRACGAWACTSRSRSLSGSPRTSPLKEQVVDFPPQPVITKDNVTMQIDTVIYFQITDPKLYTYGVENPMSAIENLTATTLRNIIGDLGWTSPSPAGTTSTARCAPSWTRPPTAGASRSTGWNSKNIMPPRDIQESMEKQMRAERERREAIPPG